MVVLVNDWGSYGGWFSGFYGFNLVGEFVLFYGVVVGGLGGFYVVIV